MKKLCDNCLRSIGSWRSWSLCTDTTKVEAIATQAVREVGFSFTITSTVLDAGPYEIWFSGYPLSSPRGFKMRTYRRRACSQHFKQELSKHHVSTTSHLAAS